MTDYSTRRIEQIMPAMIAYINSQAEASAQSRLGRTSGFWKEEFDARPNYPSVSDYLAFRREGFTRGMADGFSFDLTNARAQNLAKEQAHARATYEIFRQSADPGRVIAIDEPALGSPFVFEHHGAHRSASFWTNAITALRVQDLLAAQGLKGRALDMLEIGAGWGCMANQVHQILDLNSYAIVDLPQNLVLSTTYLASTMDLKVILAEAPDGSVTAGPRSVIAAVPGAASAIGQKYGVVVNAFSLQEMDLDTVQGYLKWISQILVEDGRFISLNAHGKAGVAAPSDYSLEYFHLDHLGMFRAFPSGLMNTIPYEMVLSLRKGRTSPDSQLLNAICCLLQFGLGDDLKCICDAFTSGALATETAASLRAVTGYFTAERAVRATALDQSTKGLPAAVHLYLRGQDAFAGEDWKKARPLLEEALQAGLQGFARLRACAKLSIIAKSKALVGWNEDFDALLAYPELAAMLDRSDPNPFIVQFDRIVSVNLPERTAAD
jgi:putative sugar O-methyltransferase